MPRYIAPAPSVQTIDFASATSKDRFALPKASIQFSPDGKCVYGVQDRPACRVLRYEADAAFAASNAASEDRQRTPPAGRRHEAHAQYLDSLHRTEQQSGVEAQLARGVARTTATTYRQQRGGSEGVARCLAWQQSSSEDREGGQAGLASATAAVSAASSLARPSTAPARSSQSGDARTTLDIWKETPFCSSSPRFKSRAAFEHRRCATPDTEAIKLRGYLAHHQQKKAAQAVQEAKETELLRVWPHGLPRNDLRRALADNLRASGLGKAGNPHSLPEKEYRALWTGVKW